MAMGLLPKARKRVEEKAMVGKATLHRLTPGTIAWARLADPRGKFKTRPVLVLVNEGGAATDFPIRCVAITTTFPDPPPATCIELPWHPAGRASTGLKRRSAAVIDWTFRARADQIDQIIGHVSPALLTTICARVLELPDP